MAPQDKGKLAVKPKETPVKTNSSINKPTMKPPFKAGVAQTPTRSRVPTSPKTPKVGTAKKPAWKRRPPSAHSGVPVPEKMRILFEKMRKKNLAAAEEKAKKEATAQ